MFSDQQNTQRERGWQYSYVQELRLFSVKSLSHSGTGSGIEEGRVREAATLLSEHCPPLPGMKPLTSGTSHTLYCLSVE